MRASNEDVRAVQTMPVSSLVCRPQVRERLDEESLAGLAQTVQETGILQPLLVRRDGSEFVVVEGHRRVQAAKMAGLTRVPVIIDDRELSEAEVVYRQLVVNCSRESLEPLEKARAIRRLMDAAKWPAAQVAVKLGISPGMVAKLLALLRLPESVQEKIASGELPLTTAYALSQAPDAESQRELASQAVNGGLTRDAVVERTKSRKAHRRLPAKPGRTATRRDRVNIALGGGRSVAVAGPGMTLASVIEWLGELIERLRGAQDRNVELADVVRLAGNSSKGARACHSYSG